MSKTNKLNIIQEQTICKMYVSGMSANNISVQFLVSINTIIRILKRNNIEVRSQSGKKLIDRTVIFENFKNGKSIDFISELTGIKYGTVHKILTDNNLLESIQQQKKMYRDSVYSKILELNSDGYADKEIMSILNIRRQYITDCLSQHNRKSILLARSIEMVSDNTAKCRECKEIKNISHFGKKKIILKKMEIIVNILRLFVILVSLSNYQPD